nr:hypothetical protein [Tanacetum cinerariifolium]
MNQTHHNLVAGEVVVRWGSWWLWGSRWWWRGDVDSGMVVDGSGCDNEDGEEAAMVIVGTKPILLIIKRLMMEVLLLLVKVEVKLQAEVVNIACYVLNRALVTKSHNKTPYELLNVSARNQTDKNAGPQDNNGNAGTQDNVDAGKEVSNQHYIVLPLWSSISSTFRSSDDKAVHDKPKDHTGLKIVEEPVNKEDQAYKDELGRLMTQEKEANDAVEALRKEFEQGCMDQRGATKVGSTNSFNTISNPVNAASTLGTFSAGGPSSPYPDAFIPANTLLRVDQNDSQIPDLEDTTKLRSTGIFNSAFDDDLDIFTSPVQIMDHPKDQILGDLKSAVQTRRMAKKSSGAHAFVSYIHKQRMTNHKDYENCLFACFLLQMELKKVYRNKKNERGIVVRNKARLVAQGHRQEEGIDYDEVFAHVARIEAIRIFLAFASFMGFIVYQMDVNSAFLYGTIEEKVYVYVDDIIFGSTIKSLCDEFEAFMHKRFQMISIGELTFFLGLQVKRSKEGIFISQDKYVAEMLKKFDFSSVRTASTSIETQKPLVKDEEATDVYLKGQSKLGLWYPRDSPFDLEAYLDSDYVGANVDKKSPTGGESSGSGPGCQETMGGTMARVRPEGASIQSIDPPLSTGYTIRSGEDRMEHDIELMDIVPQTPNDSPLSGGHTPGSDKGSMTLNELMDLCTTLLQKFLDLKTVKTAQAKEIASLKKRVTKLEQRQSSRISGFHPFRVGTSKRHSLGRVMVKKGGSTAETVSTARPDISVARTEMKNQKAKEKGIAFKDTDDSARPIRSITTLQPLPTIDSKDKDEEAMIERERQEEASKATIAEMYDEVQAQIDDDHELVVRLTHEEQEKYTGRFTHAQLNSRSFEEIRKLYIKEQKWLDAFVPIRSEEVEKRIQSRKKRAACLSTKHKSPKKQKVNDQESEDSDKEHRKCLKVVPDDNKAIDYETLDVKILIVDCESQVLGTNETCDVHVYKLTRLDGSYRHFSTFSRMLEVLDRQDVLDFHKIIMERFLADDPEGYNLILWGDLKTLVELSEDDEIWRNQQD